MVQFHSVPRLPSYVQVAEQIRAAVLERALAQGEALPPERALAQQFGVSRTTVREALRHLEAQGLLIPGGRTSPMQAASPAAAVTRFRESLVHVVKLSAVSVSDLVELRLAVETAALTRAAKAPIAEHLEAARACVTTMADERLAAPEFHAADVAFHVALVAASGNQALSAVMLAVKDAIRLHLDETLTPKRLARLRPQLVEEHRSLLRAIERGNAKAATAMLLDHLSFYGT